MFAAELKVVADNKREQQRRSINMPARIGGIGGHRFVCRVSDLSLDGARLKLFGDIEVGAKVEIALPGPTLRRGKVVWVRDYEAGCRFDEPIDPARLDELARLFGFVPSPATLRSV